MDSGKSEKSKQQIDLGVGAGTDSENLAYTSAREMWEHHLEGKKIDNPEHVKNTQIGGVKDWYQKGLAYWESTPATCDGVLGGFGNTHEMDIEDSRKMLESLHAKRGLQYGTVLDCGAGIARISKSLFSKLFKRVDILEPAKNQMEVARKNIKELIEQEGSKVEFNFYETGLESMNFETKYDLIWIQWCVGILTDNDFINFLNKCKPHLTETGVIVIKDNVASENCGEFYLDKADFSIARGPKYYKKIFAHCGYELIYEQRFSEFPSICMPVMKYAIKPKVPK